MNPGPASLSYKIVRDMLLYRFAREWISRHEERRARNLVKSAYRCDRVDSLDINITLSNERASPLLFPVFIFSSRHFGQKLKIFVSGQV